MLTVLEIIKKTTEFLAAKGIESPRLNAELLIGHALKRKRMQLYLEFERPLAEAELETIRPLIRRRAQHEPVQYITGETDFFGVRLKVDRRALIPRPETEQLLEHVMAIRAGGAAAARILDLGTGSGAIAVALAHALPESAVTATDLSEDALALAAENAAAVGVNSRIRFVRSDWFAGLNSEPYDLIVSNPPYLSAEETAQTAAEVRQFEPTTALTSADDGLADLKRIISGAPRFLVPGGWLVLETGINQHGALLAHARSAGFIDVSSKSDLAGRDRFVLARL